MDSAACIVDAFRTDPAISTERTAVSDTAAIAEANSSFILCVSSRSCSPKLRMAALRPTAVIPRRRILRISLAPAQKTSVVGGLYRGHATSDSCDWSRDPFRSWRHRTDGLSPPKKGHKSEFLSTSLEGQFEPSDGSKAAGRTADSRDGGSVFPAHANTGDPDGPIEACPLMRTHAR